MVAKITFSKRVLAALNYNEKKVQKGAAECIGAGGYLREVGEMNVYQKLEALQNRNELNDRATTKTLHVSLNFDPSEKLCNDVLFQIAAGYMERIGFADQPFLVYRHHDAGHPHLHIVSTTIRSDGSRINTHNLGRNNSECARKEIEVLFDLVRAEGRKKNLGLDLKPAEAVPAAYGKAETKRSLAQVVNTVCNTYAFTSFAQYNAALRPFNVLADRGTEEGRIYRHRGLVYRLLNEKGEKVGVPIKASSLAGKPTLENLALRFAANEKRRKAYILSLVEKIDDCLGTASSSFQDFMTALGKKGVFILPRRSAEGRLYGITFVDHQTRCVFNGAELGRGYTASAIQARLGVPTPAIIPVAIEKWDAKEVAVPKAQEKIMVINVTSKQTSKESPIGLLFATRSESGNVPTELLKKKKRRKKRLPGI